ncbi:enoyl-CoA hydratase/isomerase family protein [Candidatus Acetothermia bacterium]|nr:enoyl-CoA hydratase/isomerase family protein [Candidatus Acetothermia bacterium]MBI3643387.1 enoyl-CoA hydratase/isomerase family protein [Candidatus Acetothermia bacterium]
MEKRGQIAHVILNRPPLNVIDIATLNELNDAFTTFRSDESKVIVLRANGKAFSAGVDIKDHTPDKVKTMMKALEDVFNTLMELEQPLIGAIHGATLGGGMEFATACDLVIAAENTQLGQPEIQVGVFPPIACALLPRLLSWPRAMEFVLLGESINAQQALALGLVNRVVPLERLDQETEAIAAKLADMSGPVLKLTKRAARIGLNSSTDFRQKMAELNEIYLNQLMKLSDAQEGLQAFMEKRKAHWKDQ